MGVPITDAGGVAVVVCGDAAGDVTIGLDFAWACARPPRTRTNMTQQPASNKGQAREIVWTYPVSVDS
jgi:hypothetical protein